MSTFYDAPNDYRNYLQHHGVKGMHWGIRKDPETRALNKQRRLDEKQRFKIGREATIADYSYRKASKKVEKLKRKINRNRGSIHLRNELSRREWMKRQLQSKRDKSRSMLESHISKMQKAYGKEIKDVKINEHPIFKNNKGRINERVIGGFDWARSIGTTAGSVALGSTIATLATGNPMILGVLSVPNKHKILTSDYRYLDAASRSDQGRMIAEEAMLEELNRIKKES